MGFRCLPDGTYHSWTVMEDENGQEVVFAGYGATRGEALNARDAALATGLKAFPGLKTPDGGTYDAERLLGAGIHRDDESRDPMWVRTEINHPGKHQSIRIMDWYKQDPDGKLRDRKLFMRAATHALRAGGSFKVSSADDKPYKGNVRHDS